MEMLDLSVFCKTKAQASDFSTRLSELGAQVYHTGFHLENALTSALGMQKKDAFMVLLREQKVAVSSQSALKEFFAQLQEKVASLPVLTLTIAFEPNETVLKTISDWFLINVKKHVLFDVHVDKTLIAGCTLTYNGKFKDYSVRAAFEKVLTGMMAPSQETHKQPVGTVADPSQVHLGR